MKPKATRQDLFIVLILTLIFWGTLALMWPDASPFTRMLSVMEVR